MTSLAAILPRITSITFDCYGTLIDWEAGMRRSLASVFAALPADQAADAFTAYMEEEAAVEAGPYRSYREVLTAAAGRTAARFNLTLTDAQARRVPDELPDWQPFPDTNDALERLKSRFRLGILSNIDRDLLTATIRHFRVGPDFAVTAEDVQAYKPAHRHFERLFERHAKPGEVLHVAQSLFHDAVPCTALGIPCVWINRRGEPTTPPAGVVATFPDLKSFAAAACPA
jgi:2-haloalkanoic acid dehalogenase type II